ncbi:glycine cleavage system protein R [Microbacterium caowuchunii]|uniref:ACT domain-containing protein n=1 Tax=Microbacterium caowuchunii TaxID=2614638 RepID=A0A5N0TNI1_9MICO|nr:ACT domain-containing protein [Microbacterium caowuchunii]KAA9135864.1 ACT domain-containing protein [Microbacterium caowuchunii]
MTTLVLTVVGNDRAGLVAAVADVVADHGGNWERSQLAELSGAFAGIVEVSVPAARTESLRAALGAMEGLIAIAVPAAGPHPAAGPARLISFQVLGNDHPGIVKEVTSVLRGRGVSIERMTTTTRDAAMAGGQLFDASIAVSVPADVDVDQLTAELERLAAEIQVDVAVGD